jgi:hypothetical protein
MVIIETIQCFIYEVMIGLVEEREKSDFMHFDSHHHYLMDHCNRNRYSLCCTFTWDIRLELWNTTNIGILSLYLAMQS